MHPVYSVHLGFHHNHGHLHHDNHDHGHEWLSRIRICSMHVHLATRRPTTTARPRFQAPPVGLDLAQQIVQCYDNISVKRWWETWCRWKRKSLINSIERPFWKSMVQCELSITYLLLLLLDDVINSTSHRYSMDDIWQPITDIARRVSAPFTLKPSILITPPFSVRPLISLPTLSCGRIGQYTHDEGRGSHVCTSTSYIILSH